MKKTKIEANSLIPPNLFQRTFLTLAYNVVASVLFLGLFAALYTIDDVAYYLDYFSMFGLGALSWDFVFCLFLAWFSFRQILKDINFIRYFFLSKRHEEDVSKRGAKTSYEGPEGTGKTLNTANDTLLIACEKDEKMRLAYYKKVADREKLLFDGDKDFKALEDSFLFYERNKKNIPHFMSNFTIVYNGQKNYPFHMDYLDQKRRLAEGFSLGLTEVGNILPNAWSRIPGDDKKDKHNTKIKSETLSLSRQYFDLTITYDEQRTGEVFLGLRALNSKNISLKSRKNVLEPALLVKLRDKLENRIFKRGELAVSLLFEIYDKDLVNVISSDEKKIKQFKKVIKKLKRLSLMHSFISGIVNKIGFYVFYYDDKESTEANKVKEADLYFVTPKYFPFKFDTRGLKYDYKLFNKKPE